MPRSRRSEPVHSSLVPGERLERGLLDFALLLGPVNVDELNVVGYFDLIGNASYLVWKKYRLRSRACEEFLNRLNRM